MATAMIPPALARINEIQARFAPVRVSSSDSASSTSGADATSFGSVLASLLGSESSTTGSSLGSSLQGLLGGSDDPEAGLDMVRLTAALRNSQLRSAAATAANSDPAAPTGEDVVASAKKYLGVPYVWGGTDPAKGLDCSGLVQRAYRDLGIELPRVSYDQAKVGTEVPSLEQARPGDLIAFGSPVNHIAIYAGDGKIVQAPRTGDVVKVSDIKRPIVTIRRVIPDADTVGATGAQASVAASAGAGTTGGTTGIAGAEPFEAMFQRSAAKYGLNPRLLAAVAKTESAFNPAAVSRAGATGLMQFMPGTARDMGIDPRDPAQAIDGAARYLKTQLDRFGSLDSALAAYNAGPGAVQRYGGVPPFAETRAYVTKIRNLMGGQSPLNGASA